MKLSPKFRIKIRAKTFRPEIEIHKMDTWSDFFEFRSSTSTSSLVQTREPQNRHGPEPTEKGTLKLLEIRGRILTNMPGVNAMT
jgi:hypothetical protein